MSNYTVYVINFPNKKSYVGITSRDLEHRKKEHYRASRKQAINHALKSYAGQETWSVVCSGLSKEEVCAKEVSLIELWETKAPNGYNLTSGGEGFVGRVITREHRLNYRKNKKGIEVFFGGKKIDELEMQRDAAKKYELTYSQVNSVIKGRASHANGYSFKFVGEEFAYVCNKRIKKVRVPKASLKGRKQTLDHKISTARSLFNGSLVVAKDEITITYLSIFECCLDLNLKSQSVNKVLNLKDKSKSLFGYTFTKISNQELYK